MNNAELRKQDIIDQMRAALNHLLADIETAKTECLDALAKLELDDGDISHRVEEIRWINEERMHMAQTRFDAAMEKCKP